MEKFVKNFVVFVLASLLMVLTLSACDEGGEKEKSDYPVEIQEYCEYLNSCGVGMYGPDDPSWHEGYATDAWTSEADCREYLWQMKQVAGLVEEKNDECYESLQEDFDAYLYKLDKGEVESPPTALQCQNYVQNRAYSTCYPEGYE